VIYGRGVPKGPPMLPNASLYRLAMNCRNTPRVASLAHLLGGLEPDYSKVLRPDDGRKPVLKFFSSPEVQANLLEQSLTTLIEEGLGSEGIVVLSTRAENAAALRLSARAIGPRLAVGGNRPAGRILCTTIHAFKGLESPAVVLTDFDAIGDDRTQDLFYIGVTRALHRLHILSSEEVRAQMLEMLL